MSSNRGASPFVACLALWAAASGVLSAPIWASGAGAPGSTAAAHVEVSEDVLRAHFPAMTARTPFELVLDDEQRARIATRAGVRSAPTRLVGHAIWQDTTLLGHAVVDDVIGKTRPITFLLALDAELKVLGIEILAYRESHGGEVKRRDWRAQFRGKQAGVPLSPGRDISNIAGATISCRNLTNAVRTRLCAMDAARSAGFLERSAAAGATRLGDAASPRHGATRVADHLRSDADGFHLRTQVLMGTTLSVLVDLDDEAAAQAASSAVFAEVRRLEAILSERDPASELNRWAEAAGAGEAPLSKELDEVLVAALRLHEQSSGAHDAGAAPLVRAWRAAEAAGREPTEAELHVAREACGLRHVLRSPRGGAARLARADARLDFGGLAKGHALDRAAARLRAMGVERALLDFGGQILALDAPRGRAGWKVEGCESLGLRTTLVVANLSLAVSADDERGLVIDGRRRSHILDPRSGLPVVGRRATLVAAKSALEADGWSTALHVLGPDGVERLERDGCAALVVDEDGRSRSNPAFQRLLASSSEADDGA